MPMRTKVPLAVVHLPLEGPMRQSRGRTAVKHQKEGKPLIWVKTAPEPDNSLISAAVENTQLPTIVFLGHQTGR